MRKLLPLLLAMLLGLAAGPGDAADDDIVVIANPSVPKLDLAALQRLYTGRVVEVGGLNITVVNLASGMPQRQRFLSSVLQMDDDRYRAYWTVRRHIGKGTPPRDLNSAAQVIEFVQSTPGGVGYVQVNELRPGLNIVARP